MNVKNVIKDVGIVLVKKIIASLAVIIELILHNVIVQNYLLKKIINVFSFFAILNVWHAQRPLQIAWLVKKIDIKLLFVNVYLTQNQDRMELALSVNQGNTFLLRKTIVYLAKVHVLNVLTELINVWPANLT